MGLMLAEPDYHTRCYVEWEQYPRETIIAGMRAGYLANAPIWDDVNSFDATPLAGAIDTLIAGYPCQPFSHAGQRKGEDDPRHLWPSIRRIIGELGPSLEWCFFENVAGHLSLGLDTVLRDLRDLGFIPAAGLFSAEEVGAPHERQRVFIVAHRESSNRRGELEPKGAGCGGSGPSGGHPELANANGGNASAERKQRGGQQRLLASGDGPGNRDVDDARRSERRAISESRNIENWQTTGRDKSAGGSGKSGQDVLDHTTGSRRDAAGQRTGADSEGGERLSGKGCADVGDTARLGRREGRAEYVVRGGRDAVASTSGKVADAGEQGPQRRECGGSPGEWDRSQTYGPVAEFRGAWLFPPGPSDADAWTSIVGANPLGAPALSRRDLARAALDTAAIFTAQEAETIERASRGVEGDDKLLEVVEQAANLVDKGKAVTGLRIASHGMATRSRSLRVLGNGVVPLVAGYAWRSLSASLGLSWVDLGAPIETD